MSVYSTLDDDRHDVNRTEIVEEYLIKMANFIAFYRVPNFEELDFNITLPLYSQLYQCPNGYEHRIPINTTYYNIYGTKPELIRRLYDRKMTITEDESKYFYVDKETVVNVDVDKIGDDFLMQTYENSTFNFTLPRYQIAKYGGQLRLAY